MAITGGTVAAPGRVNLIGEHIDYHNLSVLPMALERRVRLSWQPRADSRVRMVSRDGFGERAFDWSPRLQPVAAGDWENYLRAAAQAVSGKWGVGHGIDAELASDLPPAAGLSSSSALIVAVTLALLRANGIEPSFEELMEVLPDGEHFVGTRGGGMDHAASLASRAGCASLIGFAPVSVRRVPIPAGWCFLVAHSLTVAEKSGAAREEYNARRAAGSGAPARLGFDSYRALLESRNAAEVRALAARLDDVRERECFLHTTTESLRVFEAVAAMETADAAGFGRLLSESHRSMRDWLRISSPALDELVEAAMESGAIGARLTGAGFGGCVVAFCLKADVDHVRAGLISRFYASRPGFRETDHLITAQPGDGALALPPGGSAS